MPVSSPSYFPPQRTSDRIVGINAGRSQTGDRVFLAGQNAGVSSTLSDLIVVGSSALSAGVTDTDGRGSIAIGTQACAAQTSYPAQALGAVDVTIGYRANVLSVSAGGNVTIGAQACESMVQSDTFPFTKNVCIGSQAGQNWATGGIAAGQGDCVVIGFRAARGTVGFPLSMINSVVIGSRAAESCGTSLNSQVIIGHSAGQNLTGPSAGNVLIGVNCGQNLINGAQNVALGLGQSLTGASSDNVCVGHNGGVGSGSRNVVVGLQAQAGSSGTDCTVIGSSPSVQGASPAGCIVIGSSVMNGDAANSHIFAIGTVIAGTRRGALYGDMTNGNVIIGRSIPGTNRDMGGAGATNIVKLLDGAIGAAAPVGGGYFYVNAGALHWVGSAGTDTLIAPA